MCLLEHSTIESNSYYYYRIFQDAAKLHFLERSFSRVQPLSKRLVRGRIMKENAASMVIFSMIIREKTKYYLAIFIIQVYPCPF